MVKKKTYVGRRLPIGHCQVTVVVKDGKNYPLRHVVRHSPTGFQWGYGGSGPADLALSILTNCLGPKKADKLYQEFKWEFIAPAGRDLFIEESKIRAWAISVEETRRDAIRTPLIDDMKESGDKKPSVICLCGSTRFTNEMLVKQWELTKKGHVVLSWCALPDSYFSGEDKAHIGDQEGVKEIVDEVHKRKIDISDEVFILNIGGYIGESTRSEIDYAKLIGKKISYELEPEK